MDKVPAADRQAGVENGLARARSSFAWLAAGLVLFWLAGWLTLWVGRFFLGETTFASIARTPFYWMLLLWCLGYGWAAGTQRVSPRTFWQASWLALCLLAVVFILSERPGAVTKNLGDIGYLEGVVESGAPFTRWLVGSALAGWLYAAIWRFPVLVNALPPHYATTEMFVSLLTAVSLGLGSWLLFRHGRRTLIIAFVTLNGLWFLFASGYSEYYPLVTVPFIVILLYLLDRPLRERPPLPIGVIVALLPALYVGFAPLAVLILAVYVMRSPERVWHTSLAALATAVLLLTIFWPAGIPSFFDTLYIQLNLSSEPRFAAFQGQQGAFPLFFSGRYLFSPTHLFTKSYMAYWGGILLPLSLVLVGLALYVRRSGVRETLDQLRRHARVQLLLLFNAWVLLYILLMVPKLSPTRDIDLFFVATLVISLTAGLLWDQIIPPGRMRPKLEWLLIAALLGQAAVLAAQLIFLGVPRIS